MTVDDSMRTPPEEGEDEKRRRFLPLWLLILLLILVLAVLVSRCGRGDSPEPTPAAQEETVLTTGATSPAQSTTSTATTVPTSEPASMTTTSAVVDVSGEWSFSIDVTETSGACLGEEDESFDPKSVSISQEGSALTVTGLNAGYPPWQGRVSGNTVTFGGERDEDGGITRASFTLTFEAESGALTGSESWSWEGQGQSCPTGASEVTAGRS